MSFARARARAVRRSWVLRRLRGAAGVAASAGVVSAVLVVTLVTPVQATPVVLEQAWELPPAFDSPPLRPDGVSFAHGDFSDDPLDQVATPVDDPGVPAVEEIPVVDPEALLEQEPVARDEFSDTFDVGQGLLVSRVSAEPLNVQDESEGWVPISTEVIRPGFDSYCFSRAAVAVSVGSRSA